MITYFDKERDSGTSARVRISETGADITPKTGVYQHQVRI
jgi:hypothetical protein